MDETTTNRKTALRLVVLEILIALVSVFLANFTFGSAPAIAILLGSGAFIIPNCLFIWLSLRRVKTNAGKNMLAWFYLGEAIKILSTIGIFAGSILLVPALNIGLMFISYGIMLLINLTGLAITMNK